MAQKVSVSYACDYDGKDIPRGQETTRSFGIDGREYEIDLCRKHNDRLSQALGPYLGVSRRASRPPRRRRTMAHRQRSAEIRAWAKHRGIEVSDRGRIPANVVTRFEAAERERGLTHGPGPASLVRERFRPARFHRADSRVQHLGVGQRHHPVGGIYPDVGEPDLDDGSLVVPA